MGTTDTNREISKLLWLSDSLAAVVTQTKPAPVYWWGYPGIMYDAVPMAGLAVASTSKVAAAPATVSLAAVSPAVWAPGGLSRTTTLQPAVVYPIDVSTPTAPVALRSYSLSATTSTVFSTAAAGDGLLVFGYGQSPLKWSNPRWPSDREMPKKYTHRLGVVDFANPSAPVLRAPVTLPGRLISLGEISRSGFLAFSESVVDSSDTPVRQVQVSLIDSLQASLFATETVGLNAVLAAEGRSVFVAEGSSLRRLTLDDSAKFQQVGGTATLPWTPSELQVRGLTVLGVNGSDLLRVSWPGLDAVLETWKVRQWSGLSKIAIGPNRNLYVPEGDYGVELFEAK
jgi:hypothetical protein